MPTALLLPLAALLGAAVPPAAPDLTVLAIDRTTVTGDWQALLIQGTAQVTVANRGSVASAACTLLLFEDTDGNAKYSPGTDKVFGQATIPALDGESETVVAVTVSGAVRFRNDRLFAFADSANVVAESDENDNVTDTGKLSGTPKPPPPIAPVSKWSWTTTTALGAYVHTPIPPLVCDLDGDGAPEVIVQTTTPTGSNCPAGVLRVLDGRTGTELFTLSNPVTWVSASFTPAIGDIDDDGRPEIVTARAPTGTSPVQLVAYEHDGQLKWQSDPLEPMGFGGAAIADLDQDGVPEIVCGRQVVDAVTGRLRWTGTGGVGNQMGLASASLVADVDNDGQLEVVAGNTVYSATGQIEAQAPPLYDGFNAVANFDQDPEAEIVLVGRGYVHLFNHDMTPVWIWKQMPSGGRGGLPAIGDFDGDGQLEIAVAGGLVFVVFDTDGSILWQQGINDTTSSMAGATAFDFDGDGILEIVYRDEKKLRIWRGRDGLLLWQTDMSSCTWAEYCTIADVDADGSADLVIGAVSACNGVQQGVHVFGDPQRRWPGTRKIWNQLQYHGSNVFEDGRIPRVERPHWLHPTHAPRNRYRDNLAIPQPPDAAPDLTASLIGLPCASQSRLAVRVGNGGSKAAAAGVRVDFYDGDPRTNGTLLGTGFTSSALAPGDFADVAINVAGNEAGPYFAVVDALQAVAEGDESNNEHATAPCGTAASWTNYGAGWPGTLGVPALTLDQAPALGSRRTLLIGNSLGQPTPAALVLGSNAVSLPTAFGGTLLVVPELSVACRCRSTPRRCRSPCRAGCTRAASCCRRRSSSWTSARRTGSRSRPACA